MESGPFSQKICLIVGTTSDLQETELPRGRHTVESDDMLKKLAPWAIAAAILYFLFSRVPLADAWSVARAANLELFLSVMMGDESMSSASRRRSACLCKSRR
jgi:hypothetical protein